MDGNVLMSLLIIFNVLYLAVLGIITIMAFQHMKVHSGIPKNPDDRPLTTKDIVTAVKTAITELTIADTSPPETKK